MKIEFASKDMVRILNHQFKMIGEEVTWEAIPEEGIGEGKKKLRWWEYYFFKDRIQYDEWKEWALKEIEKHDLDDKFDTMDMLYGLHYKLPKIEKGQLTMF